MAVLTGPLPEEALASLPDSLATLYRGLLGLHQAIQNKVADARARSREFELAEVAEEGGAGEDRIFALDVHADAVVDGFFREPGTPPVTVVAEGLGRATYGSFGGDPEWIVVIDPIDGTRELMFNKRAAWVLSGIAPNRPGATLGDLVVSLATELPVDAAGSWRQAAAIAGSGQAWELLRRVDSTVRRGLHASGAGSIRDGWISLVSPFPGACEAIGRVADTLARDIVPRDLGTGRGKGQIFLGQYCSTGGQMYELASGYDRMVADLRAELVSRGIEAGLCAKPYDLSAWLIPREAGAILTRPGGGPLDFPLDTTTDCSWIGYANSAIRREVEPHLHAALAEAGR